jgi:hypothetical protein
LDQAATLSPGDVSVVGVVGGNYGAVTIRGSGTSYTITLAKPISTADRVTITIGNAQIVTFSRRLDVLPGDVNDDGVVNAQDLANVQQQWLGVITPTLFGDLDGDGSVTLSDYLAVRQRIGGKLPPADS